MVLLAPILSATASSVAHQEPRIYYHHHDDDYYVNDNNCLLYLLEMNPEHHHNDLGYKNTSTSSGWSHLVPNVVNCLSRDYYYNKKSASDTPQDRRVERKTPSAGIEVLKTTVSAAEQRMEDRQRAEDFLLFMGGENAACWQCRV